MMELPQDSVRKRERPGAMQDAESVDWHCPEKKGRSELISSESHNLEVEETSLNWSRLNR